MTLAEKLLALRTEKGLSQEDLAEQMGVSRQSVSKWETGQSVPDLDKIIKLADLFGVTVDELVREGERPQPQGPRVIYVEREQQGLTPMQSLFLVNEVVGIVLLALGFKGMGSGYLDMCSIAAAVIIAGLPLLLAKKHPFLIAGWLYVGASLQRVNPLLNSSYPWGLLGGLRRLWFYLATPGPERDAYYLKFAAVGIIRGILILILLFLTGRACWRAWKKRKEDG